MKKILLTSFALMLGLAVNAQTTYFSQMVGVNTSASGGNSGFGSVKTSAGNFVTVGVSQAGGFEIRTFNSAGVMMLTTKVASSSYTIESVAFVTELDATSILITGTATPSLFFIAKVNLLTNDVTISTKPNESFSYTKGPRAVTSASGIYVAFPQFSKFDINKFDNNLTPIWSKRCEGDSTSGKNPGNDCGMLDDTTIIVVGKCDTTLGWGEYDTTGTLDSLRMFQINGYTRIYGMSKAADGSMLLAGLNMSYTSSMSGSNPVLIKVDPNGSIVWSRVLDQDIAPVFARFVNVKELPNGNIVAFGTKYEAYSDTYFDGVCTFDATGALLSSYTFGSGTKTYQMYDVKVYADGLLFSGVITDLDNGSAIMNSMIFTDFNFNTVCDKFTANITNATLPHGTSTVLTSGDVKVGDNTLATTAPFGLLTMGSNVTTDVCATAMAIDEIEQAHSTLYPNPVAAGSNINITMSETGNYTINVINTTGALVSTNTLIGSTASINTQNMSIGLYIVNVYTNGKLVNSNKISVR